MRPSQHVRGIGVLGATAMSALGLVHACAIYDPSLLLSEKDAAAPGFEAGAPEAAAGDGGVDPCAHVRPPPPPAAEDGTSNVDTVLAVSYLRILPQGTATVNHPRAPTGLDLDDTCTCPAPETCKPRGTMQHCDGDGGADDSAGGVFQTFAALSPQFNDDGINGNIRMGNYTVVFRVKSYNGGQNDKHVTFLVYVSNGTDPVEDGGNASAPRYDGTDVWTIDPTSLLGGTSVDGGSTCEGNDNVCIPFFADTQAYVSNGVLVAHLDFPILLGTGSSQILVTLSSTEIAAPLVFDGSTYRIDEGVLGGRWTTRGILSALQTADDPLSPGQHLCGDSGTYQNIKTKVCNAADITTNPAQDGTGIACDALSLAVSFSAGPARLGPIYAKQQGAPPCGSSYKDDCP